MVLCEYVSGFQGTTNIRSWTRVLFSLKRGKFIRPMKRGGDRVSGYYEYKILPGRYVEFNYEYWSKQEPCISFKISIIRLGEEVEREKEVVIRTNNKNEIIEIIRSHGYLKGVEIVRDFIDCLPGYHIRPKVEELTTKIYEEEKVKELLEFIEKCAGGEIYYGMELE